MCCVLVCLCAVCLCVLCDVICAVCLCVQQAAQWINILPKMFNSKVEAEFGSSGAASSKHHSKEGRGLEANRCSIPRLNGH